MYTSAFVGGATTIFANLTGLALNTSAGFNATSFPTELAGIALFAFAFVTHTSCTYADLVVGTTVGVTIVFHTNTCFALFALFAGRITDISVAVSIAAACVGCGTGHEVARIIHAISGGWVANAAFATGYGLAFVWDAGSVVTELTVGAGHTGAFVGFTGAVFAYLILGTSYACAGFDALTLATEFTAVALFSVAGVGHTYATQTDLFGRTAVGVAVVFHTAIAHTDLITGTGGLTR